MKTLRSLKHKRIMTAAAGLVFLYGSLAPAHAYYHEHVNHACPKNKNNPKASCPGHKPPSDKDKATTHGGVDTIGCGCASPWDVLMCFAGY